MDRLWLTIVGMGEDGPNGLSAASRDALAAAEVVMGPKRHLALLGAAAAPAARRIAWPVPFADGVAQALALRGQRVVVLASGDPFWFGAGAVLADRLDPAEWVAHPAPSVFGWAAARLGWRLEAVACLGLHAAPLARIRPHLTPGARLIVTLPGAEAVAALAETLAGFGFGASRLWVMQGLGGPREQIRDIRADGPIPPGIAAPVVVALMAAGPGPAMPRGSGLPDSFFEHDGQITKRPVRALTLSALAPLPGEMLWDIGAGSGSIGIEWLLAHPANSAVAVEPDSHRAARAQRNAMALGADRLQVLVGHAPQALAGLPAPDAVFIGGGVDQPMLEALWGMLAPGTRVVANAVTLEAEALFAAWQARVGGNLLRIELAEAQPLGAKRGWRAALPLVQWSVVR